MKQEREPVGTCFLQDGTKTVEYAPCRSSMYRKLYQLFRSGLGSPVCYRCVCVHIACVHVLCAQTVVMFDDSKMKTILFMY